MEDFEITHVFGHEPLQQYMVPFPGGRLQVLNIAWDTVAGRWFRMYPDQEIPAGDWLHWTRNAQNWNGMCAECHSTDLRKNYDPASDTYSTTWSDIDVGCEACHGPGSRHVAWAEIDPMGRPALENAGLEVDTSDVPPRQTVELCAPCHSRRGELGDYDHRGGELLDHMLPSLLEEGLYHADGQILDEVYVYGSFLQSKMYLRQVSCPDCHDSHSGRLFHEDNQLCLRCHERVVYDDPSHHFHRLRDEAGAPADAARCVKCHMVEQPYMVVDWRADHSFRVPRPDLTATLGVPNACSQIGCHDDKPLDYSLDAYRRWYGEARKPHFGTTFAAARAGDASAHGELVRLAGSDLHAPIVRATALDLLGRSPRPDGVAALRKALGSDEPLLRRTAAVALPVMALEDFDRLAPLLFDPVKAVRNAAVARLAELPRDRLAPYQREAFDRAVDQYRATLEHSLDFAASALNLGNLEAALGNRDAAERQFRRAVAIDGLFVPAKVNLAVLLSGRGATREALQLLREAAAAYPDAFDVVYSLGLLLAEAGETGEALERLGRAAGLAPRHARVRYNLGLLLQQAGRADDAEAMLRAAVELEPEGYEMLHALADHLLRRGRRAEVARLAERMIALRPQDPLGHQIAAAARAAR
jgi:tetratricopeptide (TPR) repeat protein